MINWKPVSAKNPRAGLTAVHRGRRLYIQQLAKYEIRSGYIARIDGDEAYHGATLEETRKAVEARLGA